MEDLTLIDEVRAGKHDGVRAYVFNELLGEYVCVVGGEAGYYRVTGWPFDVAPGEYAKRIHDQKGISPELVEAIHIVSMFPNRGRSKY